LSTVSSRGLAPDCKAWSPASLSSMTKSAAMNPEVAFPSSEICWGVRLCVVFASRDVRICDLF
jgi:hypothetical protein